MTKAASKVLIKVLSLSTVRDTLRCAVCARPILGRQTRFCSQDCSLKFYRRALRKQHDHTCKWGICGREFRLGRRRIG